VADSARIEELRRRVQKDPASIAFAQLAEEYRRAGRLREAVETCETGLARHPGYLSARVTLGRALLELGELEAAQAELKQVLRTAPENLAALRGLADIHHRRGELREALAHYRTALEFAPHDPELERIVEEIGAQLEPATRTPEVVDGLSFEDVQRELLSLSGGADAPDPAEPEAIPDVGIVDAPAAAFEAAAQPAPGPDLAPSPAPVAAASTEALEQWLEAIVADRERRVPVPEGPDGR
jgi:tetratricopeptide (TPR) repeat protein